MQKNRKCSPGPSSAHPSRLQCRSPVALPDVVSSDTLGAINDEELINRLRYLEEGRQKVLDAHLDPKLWEEEVAYIQREMQIRCTRRDAHDQYMRLLEREYAESEKNLPVADLDNTHFLRIVGEFN